MLDPFVWFAGREAYSDVCESMRTFLSSENYGPLEKSFRSRNISTGQAKALLAGTAFSQVRFAWLLIGGAVCRAVYRGSDITRVVASSGVSG
jgi:hypothetical protein